MERHEDAALRDDLTGAFNRRYLRELFERQWATWMAERREVSLLLLDLDLFKEVNDRFGHLVGDDVLRCAAESLGEAFRGDDPLIRYGGDEFIVVLPGTGAEKARELALRARRAMAGLTWRDRRSGRPIGIPISFSLGVAAAPADGIEADQVLAVADQRLYEDKRARQERRLASGRRLRILAAAGLVALVAGGGWMLWRGRTPPPAPEVGAPAAQPVKARMDRAEVEALRQEIARLTSRLAAERSEAAHDDSAARIRALEQQLDEVRRREREAEAAAGREASTEPKAKAAGTPRQSSSSPAEAPPGVSPGPVAGSRQNRAPVPPREAAATPVAPAPPSAPLVAPQLLHHEPPLYPYLARRLRVQGTVKLELKVDEKGHVTDVRQLSAPLGYGLDEAARQAARSATYRPATRDGSAVAGTTTLEIRFVLDDRD